jgi:AraC-like DNA-binding protein
MSARLDRILTHRPCPLLELRRWRFASPGTHWCAPGAHVGTLEIAWVDSGRVTYRMGYRELTLEPGSAFLVPPDVEHATGFVDPVVPVDAWAIHLDTTLLAEVAEVLGSEARRPCPGVVPNADGLVAAGRLLLGRAGTGGQLAAEALAEVLAVEVLQAGSAMGRVASAPADRRITAAVEQIEACYAQPLCVDDLARTAGMSRFHFSRRFREIMGQSPYRYLIETRLRNAAALLRRGHHSVTDAALSAGFTDLGRFSRMFRQWSGTAPHRYGRSSTDADTATARSAHDSARSA